MILMTFMTDDNPYSNDDTIGRIKEHRQVFYHQLVDCSDFNQCLIVVQYMIMNVVHVALFWYVQFLFVYFVVFEKEDEI